uniref:NADH-ubiquinone oxidoreductase chain 1 (Fragments) n=1 Tax=Artemia salina TaxID=85549 RepID=NU1M_ARTSA|nr:RecName: Full=NADH-ubiquinone oxidoreductase chain 1; AltName: Full=NADH dehydrogenase subunit 1 [Artemia salina]pir/S01210/ NADH2 dehydrogenase (ubiquinone) (EC 1.6.5.3) chain 1 - brine shrimp mitochondrion (fragments) [Artemia sp.]
LAETNRTPFDLAEGECQVSVGFNTEYMHSSVGFALIMLSESEYASILFMSLFSVMFCLVVYSYLWSRGSYPRYRYDNLMHLCWKTSFTYIFNIPVFLLKPFSSGLKNKDPWLYNQPYSAFKTDALIGQGV